MKRFAPKNKQVHVVVDPYPFHVYCLVGEDTLRKGIEAKVLPKEWDDWDNTTGWCRYKDNTAWILLSDEANLYTLIHECVHALVQMHVYMGLPLTQDGDEVLAYHLQHLVQRLQKQLQLPT